MRKLLFTALSVLTLAATIATGLPALADDPADGAAGKTQSVEDRHKDATAAEVETGWARAPVKETATATSHQITVAGKVLHYTATAGTLTLRDDEGKPTGSMFYVAYTLDGADAGGAARPVTFFYNGGPGSSSIWLHMGSFAPMRVRTSNPETIRPAPFAFGPNEQTLLDKTDLVFLDAMGTGFSRPLGATENKAFWGVDQDADAFARGIIRYVTRNSRWNSPKFLFGESYGTTRSAALAYQLQDRGMALNGVVLLSSILNFGVETPGYDEVYIGYLPSYAATAWYHNKVPNRPADVATFVEQARQFALGPYAAALAKGHNISPAERDAIAQQMSAFTGLSPDFIKRANLRVDLDRFQKELLRDQRLTVGRFDSRYTGVDTDAAGSSPDYDPSDTAISGAFISTFSDYLTKELKYQTDMPYRVAAYGLKEFDWDWKHKPPTGGDAETTPDVALDLAAAMRTNPYLHVMSANGYYDMATPFTSTEYDLSHMMLEPQQQKNLEFRYYPSGHMVYLNPEALRQLHADVADFIDRSVASAERGGLDRASPVPAGKPHGPAATP
ncbi:S10 family peptidase [Caulobacter sp. KR2-114]|uniref:S10 family peptidase n=1 Tax=Caulobacter sp. KR2-114 TaxID=3400912 RepID=UPI003C11261C